MLCRRQKRGGKKDGDYAVGTAVLSRMFREGVTGKVTSEQRREGGDRKSHVGICAKSLPVRKKSKLKKPKRKHAWKESSTEKRGGGEPSRGGAPFRDAPAGSYSEQDGSHQRVSSRG